MTTPEKPPALPASWGGTGDLDAVVRAAVAEATGNRVRLTPEELAPLDQFHPGGRPATLALAHSARLHARDAVLDVGGGLGGPARTLASAFGCVVTVLDLTPAYCRIGAWLTMRTRLADRVAFVVGDALTLPFSATTFDCAWTQASGMNIANKERLYGELRRVLRPGGRLALLEPATGRRVPLRFPVPWAADQVLSYLRPPEALRTLLATTGFREMAWQDVTAQTLAAMRQPAAPSPLGVRLLLGGDAEEQLGNLACNLAEGRLSLVQGVFERR